MKWWFSSWNLFFNRWARCVECSLPTVLLVDSQPRRAHNFRFGSIVCYTLLISHLFYFAFASKVFLYDIHWKTLLKIHFQLVSNFIFLPPSFSFLRHFCSYESTKDKLFLYHIWTLVRRFAGVFCKSFLPPHYNWKVTSRLLEYFTKILQKFFRYNWFFADGNISVFSKNLKHPPHILDICIPVCWGVSPNFF